jgi:hypothetical protein
LAFTAKRDSGNTNYGTYINSGGVTSLITEKGTTGTLSADTSFFASDLNNSGQVAMFTVGTSPAHAIYVGSGGPVTLVAERRGGVGDSNPFLSDPSINDAGDIVYSASVLGVSSTNTSKGIYKYSGGVTTTIIAPTSGNGIGMGADPQINNQGMIAYNSGNVGGIKIGNGSTFSNVIFPGDSLFGSTVGSIGKFSLNDRGDVAFVYILNNGSQGIGLAIVVPEPSTLIVVLVFGFAATTNRSFAKRQN